MILLNSAIARVIEAFLTASFENNRAIPNGEWEFAGEVHPTCIRGNIESSVRLTAPMAGDEPKYIAAITVDMGLLCNAIDINYKSCFSKQYLYFALMTAPHKNVICQSTMGSVIARVLQSAKRKYSEIGHDNKYHPPGLLLFTLNEYPYYDLNTQAYLRTLRQENICTDISSKFDLASSCYSAQPNHPTTIRMQMVNVGHQLSIAGFDMTQKYIMERNEGGALFAEIHFANQASVATDNITEFIQTRRLDLDGDGTQDSDDSSSTQEFLRNERLSLSFTT